MTLETEIQSCYFCSLVGEAAGVILYKLACPPQHSFIKMLYYIIVHAFVLFSDIVLTCLNCSGN